MLDDIRRALNAIPFRPFVITMRNEAVFRIQEPDQVAIGPGNATSFMVAGEQDDYLRLSVQDVQTVAVLPVHVLPPPGWEGLTERATSVDQLCQQISNLGRIGWFYRGESQLFPKRIASLGRYLASNAPSPIEAECSEVAWFQTRAHSWLSQAERDMVRKDVLAWLTLMQHHFAPTRLLDWTHSPWVAAYHAASLERDHSGFIWAFSGSSFARKRPIEWKEFESKLDAVETVRQYREVLKELPSELLLAFHLGESTERMVAQQGAYTFGHPPALDHTLLIGRYIEPGEAKVLLVPNLLKRDLIERMRSMNLTAAALFPGLDGVGKTTLETMRIGIGTPPSGF